MDPKLATAETALLLDKIGYVSRMAKKRALEQQNKFVGIDNSLKNVLRTPQIDLLTPIGQVKNYIKEMQSGLYKNRLMAQFEAESNPEFGRFYNSVPERERVFFAIQPMIWERYNQLSRQKEGEKVPYGFRKGLTKRKEKKQLRQQINIYKHYQKANYKNYNLQKWLMQQKNCLKQKMTKQHSLLKYQHCNV